MTLFNGEEMRRKLEENLQRLELQTQLQTNIHRIEVQLTKPDDEKQKKS